MIISLLFAEPALFVAWLIAILTALSVHEFSHAWAAYALGDSTAKDMGRLTLNPVAHIDPAGFLLLLVVGFGWGKPVQVNPYNLRYRKWGDTLVSLAGPASNLVMVIFFGALLKFSLLNPVFNPAGLFIQLLNLLVIINVVLFIFNLIPVPPLDGSKFLLAALPDRYFDLKERLLRQGPLLLLFLIIFDRIFDVGILSGLFNGIINFVYRFF